MDSAINYILAEGGKLSTPQHVVDHQGDTYTPNAPSSLSAPSTNDDYTNPIDLTSNPIDLTSNPVDLRYNTIDLKSDPIDLTSSDEHIVKVKGIDKFAQGTDLQGIRYITEVHGSCSISSSNSTTPIAHYSHKCSGNSSMSTPLNHRSNRYDADNALARKLHI